MTKEFGSNQKEWNSIQKPLLLFIMVYLFLYMFPFPIDSIPFIGDLLSLYTKTIDFTTVFIGKHLFGMQSLVRMDKTGSGDTSFDYFKLLTFVLISIPASFVVFIFVRRQKNYLLIYEGLVIYARYYVGLYMIIYGFSKFDEGQFVYPGFVRLEQPYGDSSPMGLLWAFMGYSKAYTVFLGVVEILGGALLFFRRTTLLGSLITLVVLLNIVMLNFSYDFPVKLFSSHLLLITIFILAPYILRLYYFFVLNTSVEISYSPLHLPKRWMVVGRVIFKSAIIVGIPAYSLIAEVRSVQAKKADESLSGSYTAELFILHKDTLPPLTSSAVRWNKMIIENGYVRITTMSDSSVYYRVQIDSAKKTIQMDSYGDKSGQYFFTYESKPDNRFRVSGLYKGDSISVFFKRKTYKDYNLTNREFHWVNEFPFNP